jgi:hypothetical protein
MANLPDSSSVSSNQSSTRSETPDLTQTILAQIILLPSEDEEDDFKTITTVGEVQEEIFKEARALPEYTSSIGTSETRDAGVILLVGAIAHQVLVNKDLVIEIFKVGAAAISLLAKQRHVKKVEVRLNGDVFSVDEPDKATIQRLLDIYETAHPGKATALTSSSSMQITGIVSKTT